MFFFALPDITTEDILMRRLRRGDQEALRQIFEAYFESIYQFVRSRLDNQAEAEDIVSEVFLKLVHAFRNQKLPNHSLRGWLFKVARNELNDCYHVKNSIQTCPLDESLGITDKQYDEDAELEALRTMSANTLRSAIRQLTIEQQEVIALRYGQMLSLNETAELLGKNVNAIKVLQYRAIRTLRRILSETRVSAYHD